MHQIIFKYLLTFRPDSPKKTPLERIFALKVHKDCQLEDVQFQAAYFIFWNR